jgi:hypothetical protein
VTVHLQAGCAHFVVLAIVPPRRVSQESSHSAATTDLRKLRFRGPPPYAGNITFWCHAVKRNRARPVRLHVSADGSRRRVFKVINCDRTAAARMAPQIRIDALESKCDRRFTAVFQAIRQLMAPPPNPRRPIGYSNCDRKTLSPGAHSAVSHATDAGRPIATSGAVLQGPAASPLRQFPATFTNNVVTVTV